MGKKRSRSARGDATIGAIEKNITKVYDLPEESIVIHNPDGRDARTDKRIETLRDDYGYEDYDDSKGRTRSARSDATIGAIERDIEKKYALPKGSVVLYNPDGTDARTDKHIENLRGDYESYNDNYDEDED